MSFWFKLCSQEGQIISPDILSDPPRNPPKQPVPVGLSDSSGWENLLDTLTHRVDVQTTPNRNQVDKSEEWTNQDLCDTFIVGDIYIFPLSRTWRELAWHWSTACWSPCCWSGPPGCCTWCWRPACNWTSPCPPQCQHHLEPGTVTLGLEAMTVFFFGSSDLTWALNPVVMMRRCCHPHPETNNYTQIET